jgi:hypothetical protein
MDSPNGDSPGSNNIEAEHVNGKYATLRGSIESSRQLSQAPVARNIRFEEKNVKI